MRREAKEIYKELLLVSHIRVDPTSEQLVLMPIEFSNVDVTFDFGLILKAEGNDEQTVAYFNETWDRLDSQRKVSDFRKEIKSRMKETEDSNSPSHHVKRTFKKKAEIFDFLQGTKTFEDWLSDPMVFEAFANEWRKRFNFAFAADWYVWAIDALLARRGFDDLSVLSDQDKEWAVDMALSAAECLATLGAWEQAEEWAHLAFGAMANNIGAPRLPCV